MDPVAAGALAELIAVAVTSAAGRTWALVRGTPEGRAIKIVIGEALSSALRDAALPVGAAVDSAWVDEVARIWESAFTPEVTRHLVASIADPSDESARRFTGLAKRALMDSRCDLAELGRTFWVEEFLAVLPRRFFNSLNDASLRDPGVRGLVEILLLQRADSRARGLEPPTPSEVRQDLITLLRGLDRQARVGGLPPYLPTDADVTALSRTVRVRLEVRSGSAAEAAVGEGLSRQAVSNMYRLPVERKAASDPPRPWPEVAREYRRLVVLADPGMGKSWLIRTETHRLCKQALDRLASYPSTVIIPVPMRCDQLATGVGEDLTAKAAAHLVEQGLLPARSRAEVARKVRAGEAVVLLDALDELTPAERGPLRDLLRSWTDQAGDHVRCLITSRIAGYTGPPLPGGQEIELQAFTRDDMVAAMAAWRLPPAAAARVKDRVKDPAMAAMARIPLLLALLCSLAAQQPAGEALPRTRGHLYERVLRWFLTRTHRSLDDPAVPTLDEVEVETLLEILAPLAYKFATQPAGWTDLMPGDGLLQAIRTVGPPFTELHRPAAEVLRELSVGAGILVPEGDPSAGRSVHYLFLHRTVAEYLTARHLATLQEADCHAVIDQHLWFDPDWTEVIPMLGERLSPQAAQALIQHLLANESDPFHRSLFTAARIWGARADADRLLAPEQARELSGHLDDLLRHWLTGDTAASHCAYMTYLPQPLLTRLLERLADQDEDVRAAAVRALTGREHARVVEALLERLHDHDDMVREAAVRALAGQNHLGVLEALLRCLTDTSRLVRVTAVKVLAGRNDPGVTEALLGHLNDQERPMWAAVAAALASRDDPGLVEALLRSLTDQNPTVRVAAVRALTGRDKPTVTEALLGCLTDQDSSVQAAAVKALKGLDKPDVTEALLGCLTAQDSSVRTRAARALANRDDPGLTKALLGCLTNTDPVRRAAVRALAGRTGPEVTEALLGCLADTDRVRATAVRALAGRDDPGVMEALLRCLTDRDPSVRAAAARTLVGWDDPGVTEALLECLGDTGKFVRAGAVTALAGRNDQRVTEALLGSLTDTDRQVRRGAIKALAGRDDPGVVKALLDRLASQEPSERLAAIRALAGRDDPGVTEALLDCLALVGDDLFILQAAAAQALAVQGSPQSLLKLANEVHRLNWSALPEVAEAAERLMIRYYRYIEPTEQPEVLGAMGWLTTAALMADTERNCPWP